LLAPKSLYQTNLIINSVGTRDRRLSRLYEKDFERVKSLICM